MGQGQSMVLSCRLRFPKIGGAGKLVALTGLALLALDWASPSLAQEQKPPDQNGVTSPSIATSMPYNGDPWGTRAWLAGLGLTYNFIYTHDSLANVHGGLRRGLVDQGKLEYNTTFDFEKLTGWHGLTFYTNVFFIHNTGRFRRDFVGGVNTIAAIEADSTVRLSELWAEQKFWDDKASLRVGQLAADVEFFYSELSFPFLQSDWPTITALNLPSGGPAYPLSTPGVRLKVEPTPDITMLLAVFNGDPAGPPPPEDEQVRNRYGLNFRLQDPPFIITETQIRANHGKSDSDLARAVKLGAWAHAGDFDDPRVARDGTLLAALNGSGEPLRRHGNFGFYGVFEQQLYRPKGGAWDSGISLFGRVSASPGDRNPIDFYADGGIVFSGMVPGRPDDKFGVSVMFARYSDAAREFDRDRIAFTGLPGVVRDFEANLELNYTFQIISGWVVQPILTYVWHPSGKAAISPETSRNATVIGLRSMWQY
jgi:porin